MCHIRSLESLESSATTKSGTYGSPFPFLAAIARCKPKSAEDCGGGGGRLQNFDWHEEKFPQTVAICTSFTAYTLGGSWRNV